MFFLRSFLFLFCLLFTLPATAIPPQTILTIDESLWGKRIQEDASFETTWFFSNRKKEKKAEEKPLPKWLKNAVAIKDVPEGAPMIAIVIDDLGFNKAKTQAMIDLPAPITASFLAYADDLERQTQNASEAGHELLIHAPMEPINADNFPGAGALITGMTPEEIRDRLSLMLGSFEGYVGINNHMGSKFTADKEAMKTVIEVMKENGLLFLDSLTSKNSVGVKTAQQYDLPYAVRHVFLDNSKNKNEIRKQLEILEEHALKYHFGVAIGHPHTETNEVLKEWIPDAKERGFVFVPISMIAVLLQDLEHTQNVQALNMNED